MTSFVYRGTAFVFSIICYGVFLLVFLYLLAFLANARGPLVHRSRARHGLDGQSPSRWTSG